MFLTHVFDSKDQEGYRVMSDKAVLYKVLEQKLLGNDNSLVLSSLVDESIKNIKNSLVLQELINSLKSKYKIVNYYQGT